MECRPTRGALLSDEVDADLGLAFTDPVTLLT
jgi:hypothetical protein